MRRRHIRLITNLLILAALAVCLSWKVFTSVRQERLNHALIAAIKRNDSKTVLALLADGADPNSRAEPGEDTNSPNEPPQHLSLWRLLSDKLRGKYPVPSTTATALIAAQKVGGDDPTLTEMLLSRGAKVNALEITPEGKVWTPLMADILNHRPKKLRVLLHFGADVNQKAFDGCTPLQWAYERRHEDT